jgi:hypothetical protein
MVPLVGEAISRSGAAGPTVYETPLLLTPPIDTTTLPLVAPAGTVTLIWLLLHVVAVAVVPLNWMVLVP